MSDTRQVEIVYAHDPETDGPDLNRIGTVVEVPKGQARQMVQSGEARYADIPRADNGRPLEEMTRGQVATHASGLGLPVTATMSKSEMIARIAAHEERAKAAAVEDELGKLTKAELQAKLDEHNADLPDGAEPVSVAVGAKKDDLVAAVRQVQQASISTAEPTADAVEEPSSSDLNVAEAPEPTNP